MSEGRVSNVFSHPSHRKIKYNLSIYKIICKFFYYTSSNSICKKLPFGVITFTLL